MDWLVSLASRGLCLGVKHRLYILLMCVLWCMRVRLFQLKKGMCSDYTELIKGCLYWRTMLEQRIRLLQLNSGIPTEYHEEMFTEQNINLLLSYRASWRSFPSHIRNFEFDGNLARGQHEDLEECKVNKKVPKDKNS